MLEYSQDLEIYTNSEMCSDDTSYLAANPNMSRYQVSRDLTPSFPNNTISKQSQQPMSLVIREKKSSQTALNNEYCNTPQPIKNFSNRPQQQPPPPPPPPPQGQPYDDWSSTSSHYYNNDNSNNTSYHKLKSIYLSPQQQQHLNVVGEENRNKNYQELSESINDLFSNLLRHLEKQKNKDYLINCDDTSLEFNAPPFKKNSKVISELAFNIEFNIDEWI